MSVDPELSAAYWHMRHDEDMRVLAEWHRIIEEQGTYIAQLEHSLAERNAQCAYQQVEIRRLQAVLAERPGATIVALFRPDQEAA